MRPRTRLLGAAIALSGLASTGLVHIATAATPATVSGTVSRADGGSPKGIQVVTRCNIDNWDGYATFSTTAAADGSYQVRLPGDPGDPADECTSTTVEFHDPTGRYAPQYYDDAVRDTDATTLTQVPGDTALGAQTLSRLAGTIRGRVVNTYGRPVRDRDLRVGAVCCEDNVLVPRRGVGAKGGFVLRGLLPSRYLVFSPGNRRYAGATVGSVDNGPTLGKLRVTAGATTRAPRLVLKDRPTIRFTTTWHARTAMIRLRVSSALTRQAARGQVRISVDATTFRQRDVRLRGGRAVVTIPVKHRRGGFGSVVVAYRGSLHVASGDRFRAYRF